MRSRRGAVAVLVAALGVAPACARPGNPRGGVPDRRPPAVLTTEPAPSALVRDPNAVVRFRFNERISERPQRGTLDDAVMVSPATGAVRVEHGSDWIGVRVAGGFIPGQVYRVTLLPVISDLFGNTMRDPFELVFSTGGQMVATVLAGQALDRITGKPMPDLLVQLLPSAPQPDTVVYASITDQQGLYFFRYVPPAPYRLVAFLDRNRNRRRDPREPSGDRALTVPLDTLFADVTVLEPDSTAATVARAEVVDSTTLRIHFSDYLDPEFVRGIGVTLAAPEGEPAPRVTQLLHPTEYEARRDTTRASQRPPDAPLSRPGEERMGMPIGVPLPRQELIALLDAPLAVNVEYKLTALGIVNINRIPLGRGETTVVRKPPPPRPAGARPDSLAPGARRDSIAPAGAPRDSAAVRRDTVAIALRPGRRIATR